MALTVGSAKPQGSLSVRGASAPTGLNMGTAASKNWRITNAPAQNANIAPQATGGATGAGLNTIGGGTGYSTGGGGTGVNTLAIRNQAASARDAAIGAGRNSFGDLTTGYSSGADGLLQKIRMGQEGINQSRENNALNRLRSLNDLRDSVRQGIQSGSVRLANSNALDSSAAEAVAKGYGRFGTQQSGDINNEYALGERDIDTNQRNLDYEREAGFRQLEDYKRSQAQSIGNSVYDRLASIQESAMSQGIDSGIGDANAYRQQIINEALSQLAALDQRLRGEAEGIRGLAPEQVQANAYRLSQSGGGAGLENNFQYQTAPGIGAVQNGAPLAQLPLVRRPEDQLV